MFLKINTNNAENFVALTVFIIELKCILILMKNSYNQDFDLIKSMTNKIRSVGNLNESINFIDEYDDSGDFIEDENGAYEEPMNEPVGEDNEGEQGSAIDQIREIALKGMVALCKNTSDPQYDVLKQIFNYCDKINKQKDMPEEK